ncbi:hypothetical protein M405DRAFT_699006, partial [Rhizopogon salebrosus TDB-379]
VTCNIMSVLAGLIRIHAKFVRNLEDNKARANANADHSHPRSVDSKIPHNNFSINQSKLNTVLSPSLRTLL